MTITVEQVDREAAVTYLQSLYDEWCDRVGGDYYRGERIATGLNDDDPLTQAFARHRIQSCEGYAAATHQAEEQIKLLRDFVRGLDCECDSYHSFTCGRCQALEATNG